MTQIQRTIITLYNNNVKENSNTKANKVNHIQ